MPAEPPPPPVSSISTIEAMLLEVTAGRDALAVGTALGEYVVDSVLGRDDATVSYLAHDRASGAAVQIDEYFPRLIARRSRQALVKLLEPKYSVLFRSALIAFVAEAMLLSKVSHDALLSVLDVWESNGTAYRATPYEAGRSLRLLRQGAAEPMDEAKLRSLLNPLAEALRELHVRGAVHGNVSPASILVRPDGRPLLLGMDRARRELREIGGEGEPHYLAPEQMDRRVPVHEEPSTDVYALCAVALFCVSGRPPAHPQARAVEAVGPMAALAARLERDDPPRSYSPALVGALDLGLQPDPWQRWSSIDELIRALRVPDPHPQAGDAASLTAPAARSAAVAEANAAAAVPGAQEDLLFAAAPDGRDGDRSAGAQATPGPHGAGDGSALLESFEPPSVRRLAPLLDGARRPDVPSAPERPQVETAGLRETAAIEESNGALAQAQAGDAQAPAPVATATAPSEALAPSPAPAASSQGSKTGGLRWLVGALALALAATGGWYVWRSQSPEASAGTTTPRSAAFRPPPATVALAGAGASDGSLSQRPAAMAAPADRAESPLASVDPLGGARTAAATPDQPEVPPASARTVARNGATAAGTRTTPRAERGVGGRRAPGAGSLLDICPQRTQSALSQCVREQCRIDRFSSHPQCIELRRAGHARRRAVAP